MTSSSGERPEFWPDSMAAAIPMDWISSVIELPPLLQG